MRKNNSIKALLLLNVEKMRLKNYQMIKFGTLYLQTAGQNFNPARLNNDTESARSAGIEFEDISHPVKVKKIINELIITKRKRNGGQY